MKVVIPNRAESAVRNLLLATLLHEKHDMYIYIRIYMYNIMKRVHGAGFHRPEGMVRASTRMPFPGPETALPSTIGLEVKGSFPLRQNRASCGLPEHSYGFSITYTKTQRLREDEPKQHHGAVAKICELRSK